MYHEAHLVRVFPSHLGTGDWQPWRPPGFSLVICLYVPVNFLLLSDKNVYCAIGIWILSRCLPHKAKLEFSLHLLGQQFCPEGVQYTCKLHLIMWFAAEKMV
jgi:hypothetical protein